MVSMVLDSTLYSKEALIKSCYAFLDKYYFHLGIKEKQYIVEISSKSPEYDEETIKKELENEVLAQTVRINVANKTRNLRELIMARAMASTIIDEENHYSDKHSLQQPDKGSTLNSIEDDEELREILQDWFKVNE